MQIIKQEPVSDSFLDDSLYPISSFSKFGWDLAVDVYEDEGTAVAKMILPGINKEDVDVTIEGDLLTIIGKRSEDYEIDDADYYRKEIRRGSFTRSVTLPSYVDAAKAQATLEKGILTVAAPEIKGEKIKAIKVKVQ